MKRIVLSSVGLLALGLMGLLPAESFGFGCRRACGRGCGSPCATTSPGVTTAPKVEYVERKVTRYKENWVEKEVVEKVSKMVTKDEKYKYIALVPVTKEEKRKVKTYKQVTKDEPYEYTVMVPKKVEEKRKVTVYECHTSVVKEMVPCRSRCGGLLGRCCRRDCCDDACEMREVCRTVVKRVPVEKEVIVCRIECVAEKRKGVRKVCTLVPEEREITVKVCVCERQEREGTRKICSWVTEDVKRKVKVCERVPYETVEKVAVCHRDACDRGHRCGILSGCGLRSGGCGILGGGCGRRGGCCN